MAKISISIDCDSLDTGGYFSQDTVEQIVSDHADNILRHLGTYETFQFEVEYEPDKEGGDS